MGPSARAIAEHASFRAFLHCYLQEVDSGQWCQAEDWSDDGSGHYRGTHVCQLALDTQRARLAVDVLYFSAAGRHRFGQVRLWSAGRFSWSTLEPEHAMFMLVRELYTLIGGMMPEVRRSRELELFYRLTDSYQLMARYIAARQADPLLLSDRFIDSEQSLLFGHTAHPTPKSRQGLAEWQHASYAPELAGRFQLQFFSVQRNLVTQDAHGDLSAAAMVETTVACGRGPLKLPADRVLVPAHPLQAQWLLCQPEVMAAIASGDIQPLGPLGPAFTATSSVRTLYCEDCDWMLKFSIPVRVTNSLRVNKHHELRAGVVMARLIEQTGFLDQETGFHIIQDPAYLTVRLPGQRESGFEVILRDNPFHRHQDRGILSVAALTQPPLANHTSRLRTLIEGLALNESRGLVAVSRDWFRQYLDCAIEPALRLYDDHGIALEAHQQNSLLDLSSGYPSRYYYRDNQGYYLSESRREELEALCPDLSDTPELFYRDAMIRDRFCYYLVVNQLFSVIARFGEDGLLEEAQLLDLLRHALKNWLDRFQGPARPLVAMLLSDARLPYKGNLLTRVHDVDELNAELEMAVYTSIRNPLHKTLADRNSPRERQLAGPRHHDVA